MAIYTQTQRPLAANTPLGNDVLLLTRFRGQEAISQLFNFQLDLLAEAKNEIPFDRILGQNITVEMRLAGQEKRYFNGLVKRFSQGHRDETFVHFRAEIVPKLWLLTKKVRSRIFQHLSVPDILRQVLSELDATYEISETYYQRDYCVQYRESDFDFASRLMEEEGIYYFFKHSNTAHQMVVTDMPTHHPSLPEQSNVIYEEVSGGVRKEMRITAWEKKQELRSGEYTLWDHCFELPGKHLEAKRKIVDSVAAGEATHKLSVGGNEKLEIYDYPGGYAQRFDGVDRSGGEKPQNLKDILPDSERTAKVRMEQEAATSLEIVGVSNCGHFAAGHQFKLQRHFNADDRYLLTRVDHDAHVEGNYRSNEAAAYNYENQFICVPVALPYRPQRVTRKPVIAGMQTATIVGPQGEEIFCDKYGRVKLQFHWDREGKKNADSSCWVRVAQVWAGKNWGAFFWPRIGHEVVVIFEEGDPDQPLIVGSVYNAENMPPFQLPLRNNLSGFKSASHRGNPHSNFNGIVLDDKKGHEHLAIHSERHMSFNSEYDKSFRGGRHKHELVSNVSTYVVGSLPGGGGSGGGDDYKPLGTVDPQGVPGLNSIFVFGENLQTAIGLNHQLAVGSNLQICVNPIALAQVLGLPLPPGISAALGSGVGGNVQLTLGTSTNIVLGETFNLNLGKTTDLAGAKNSVHLGTKIVCGMLGSVVLLWVILYGMNKSADGRVIMVAIFETLVQMILMSLMVIEASYQKAGDDWTEGIRTVFNPVWEGKISNDVAKALLETGEVVVEVATVLALALSPAITTALTEHFE